MKKSVLFITALLLTFSLTAFSFFNWSNPGKDPVKKACNTTYTPEYNFVSLQNHVEKIDFFYEVDSRFATTITKEDLLKAKTILDIIPAEGTRSLQSFENVQLALLPKTNITTEIGDNELLNAAQLKLLQTTDYSSNFYITADCKKNRDEAGSLDIYELVYYLTIVPEKEAAYKDGHDALMNYLKENSARDVAHVRTEQLKPGKAHFVVTKDGKIDKVKLESTSGYASVDEKMVQLIENLPGTWEPATNAKGETVEQELVFSFGMIGC